MTTTAETLTAAELVDSLRGLVDECGSEFDLDVEVGGTLADEGYMTRDDGLVLRTADGRTFLVRVTEDRR